MHNEQRQRYDTRPLHRQELIEAELTLLDQLVGHLREMLKEVRGGTARPGGSINAPWAVIDTRRTPRAMMLDGERGTGKTSLMLTFLQGVGLAHEGEDSPESKAETEHWRGDRTILAQLRVLPIADLHPMPKDMPIYAWLMQGFTGAAELADREMGGAGAGGGRRPRHEGHESLTMRLKQIQQAAVVAWDGARSPRGRGQDEWLLNEAAQITEWATLESRWQAWVSDLLDSLKQVQQLGPHDLLILPIDDLDLYNRHGRDLLLALRRLYHPRLVFLLNGDYRHLIEVVAHAYREDMGKCADTENRTQDKAMVLATALAEKVIPASMRLQVTLPGVRDLMEKMEGWRKIFQAVKTTSIPKLSDDALNVLSLEDAWMLYTQELPELDERTRFRFRPLSQLLDKLRTEPPTFRVVIDGLRGAVARPNREELALHGFTMTAFTPRPVAVTYDFDGFRLHSYLADKLVVVGLTQEGSKIRLSDTNLTLLDLIEVDAELFTSPSRYSEKSLPYQPTPVDGTVRTILSVDGFPGVDIPAWRSLAVSAPLARVWFHRVIKAIETRVPAGFKKWSELRERYLGIVRLFHGDDWPSTDVFDGESTVLPDPLRDPLRPESDPPDGQHDRPAEGPMLRTIYHDQIEYGLSMCTPEGGLLSDEAGRLLQSLVGRGHNEKRQLDEEEKRRLDVLQLALEERAEAAPFMIAKMREGAPLHPWHVLPMRLAHGDGLWWLKLKIATSDGDKKTSLDAGLLERAYGQECPIAGRGQRLANLSALFYLSSSNSGRAFAHAVSFAIGEWLLASGDEAHLMLNLADQVSKSRSREGTGILLRDLYQWILSAPTRLPEKEPDEKALKERALRLRNHMVDGLQIAVAPNGERLSFSLSSPPRWERVGPQDPFVALSETLSFRYDGRPWVLASELDEIPRQLLADEPETGSWLSSWARALRAMTGVLQSYRCDIDGTTYGAIRSDPMLAIRGEVPVPVPPFHAWIDHEILAAVMRRAVLFTRGVGFDGGPGLRDPGALSRWLLVLYTRVCCELLDGIRSGHIDMGTKTFSVPYPLSNSKLISRTAEQLKEIANGASREELRAWANELDRILRLGLDDEARSIWESATNSAAQTPSSTAV